MTVSKLAPLALSPAFLLLMPLSSHALDETPLSMVYEVTQPRRPSNPGSLEPPPAVSLLPRLDECRLALRGIDDVRPNKESAGAMILMMDGPVWAVPLLAASVRTGDGRSWLKGGVNWLATAGLATQSAAPQEGVDVALRLAQTWTGGMNIHSHVVLQVSYPQSGDRKVRRYHGFASKLNGFASNSEFMTTLNMGLQDALQQFAKDLERACKGETL